MTDNLEAGLFAVDAATREVAGLLMPYNERSRAAAAAGIRTEPVMFRRGDIGIPADADIVTLNRMHDRFDPLGRATSLEDTDAGVVATFRIAATPEGDAWLADHGDLVRLSAEVANMRRRPDGTATGDLVGAGLVDEGAFASAALFSIDGDAADDDDTETTDPAPAEPDTEPDAEPDEDEEEEAVTDAAPTTMLARRGTTAPPALARPTAPNASAMFAAMSAVATGRATAEDVRLLRTELTANAALFALNDVAYDGVGGVGAKMIQPQWLGEVTDGVEYKPIYADLFTPAILTQLAMAGWVWTTKPAGDDWTGNKAAIPSNAPAVAAVSENASRWAGGHDHAREHKDFGTPGYFESYYAAMVESFLLWLDTLVITEALAAATTIEADNPAGLEIGSGMSALIDGAVQVVTVAKRLPTFGLVTPTNWKQMLKTPHSAILGYLNAALGLEEGTLDRSGFVIRPSADLGAGVEAFVGAKSAGRVYVLPGSPIRAEADNIANGGIDTGVFGYGGFLPVNDDALVKVTTYTP